MLARSSLKPLYKAEHDPKVLLPNLPTIIALADAEKEALGFLRPPAYMDAIRKRRLVGMMATRADKVEPVGFVLFSGVYPNARIQQIVVAKSHRRAGIASALLNEVVSQLEVQGYLNLTAAVASDLPVAQAFYERNGFIAKRSREGGQARNRQIVVRARELQTPNLFTNLEPPSPVSQWAVDLGLRYRNARQAPLYAIDLNVLFDVTKAKNRPRAPLAEKLIAAALAHQIRLAIAPEFLVELKRRTKAEKDDPILRLALQLPRLPELNLSETDRLTTNLHATIFETPHSASAGSPQALSDARHLAEAVISGASAYVTSDGTMLSARATIFQDFGIDVTNLEEFVALLPTDPRSPDAIHLKDSDISSKAASIDEIRDYLEGTNVSNTLRVEFVPSVGMLEHWSGRAIFEGHEMVAVSVYVAPTTVDGPARILVHVRSDHVASDTIADHLLEAGCNVAASSGPVTIELPDIPGQTTVRRLATFRGFLPVRSDHALIKVAVGRPVTVSNWSVVAQQLRQKTRLRIPENPPENPTAQHGVEVEGPDGQKLSVRLPILEEALGPTLVIWPGRGGIIVPIARSYADDLLGTGNQLPLFGRPEASLLARRSYFNTPRSAKVMRPGTPILFYESRRSGGRGAVIACARVVDATVVAKEHVPKDLYRRAVVEDVNPLTKSRDLLATTFDNLLRFPKPVWLEELRALRAVGSANLQTTTALPSELLSKVLEKGWMWTGLKQ